MIVHTLKMCTSYIVKLFHCFFSFLMGVEPRHFSHLSGHPQHFRGAKFVLSVTPKIFILFIQTLPNDCSHIEDELFLYCACFKFSLIFEGC